MRPRGAAACAKMGPMTVAHPWTVTVTAEGDRELSDEEYARFVDVVEPAGATPFGAGSRAYGLTVVLAAGSRDEALSLGAQALRGAAVQAGLPDWPINCSAAGEGPPGSDLPAPDAGDFSGSHELADPPDE